MFQAARVAQLLHSCYGKPDPLRTFWLSRYPVVVRCFRSTISIFVRYPASRIDRARVRRESGSVDGDGVVKRITSAVRIAVMVPVLVAFLAPSLAAQQFVESGRITDPQGNALPGATIVFESHGQIAGQTFSGPDGQFQIKLNSPGRFTARVSVAGFRPVTVTVDTVLRRNAPLEIRMGALSSRVENVTVTADMNETDVLSPDPAEKVFVRQDLLDANPGRPGAPVSIPGYPIETASSGIKAPQYFAPGVAGDHGEPIAQYVAVGTYLLPNNLSANAHGNGYSDPNIFIPEVLESVRVDGGAYDVREGNHSVNMAATYRPAVAS